MRSGRVYSDFVQSCNCFPNRGQSSPRIQANVKMCSCAQNPSVSQVMVAHSLGSMCKIA